MIIAIEVPKETIEDFCRRWRIKEFAFFGSVLRDDFRSDSDIDVLVTFAPGSTHTLFDLGDMQTELERLFGRPVDVVSRRGVEQSHNPIRKKAIPDSAVVVHAA